MSNFLKELSKRRTFGIVAHPDAGKTTLTEKLLLFGGAIQTAGAVKSNKIKKTATTTKKTRSKRVKSRMARKTKRKIMRIAAVVACKRTNTFRTVKSFTNT